MRTLNEKAKNGKRERKNEITFISQKAITKLFLADSDQDPKELQAHHACHLYDVDDHGFGFSPKAVQAQLPTFRH